MPNRQEQLLLREVGGIVRSTLVISRYKMWLVGLVGVLVEDALVLCACEVVRSILAAVFPFLKDCRVVFLLTCDVGVQVR